MKSRMRIFCLLGLWAAFASVASAQVAGTWSGKLPVSATAQPDVRFQFQLQGATLSGTMTVTGQAAIALTECGISGTQDRIIFSTTESNVKVTYEGVVGDGVITLTRRPAGQAARQFNVNRIG